MNEFSLWDREGDAHVPAPCGDCNEELLQFADVASVGRGGHGDRKVVDIGDHESFGNRHMQGRNIQEEKQGGDRGPLRSANRDRGGEVGGSLEQQGTGPFRQEGGDRVDHIGGQVGG